MCTETLPLRPLTIVVTSSNIVKIPTQRYLKKKIINIIFSSSCIQETLILYAEYLTPKTIPIIRIFTPVIHFNRHSLHSDFDYDRSYFTECLSYRGDKMI